MKRRALVGTIVAGFLMSAVSVSLMAQNGPGPGRNGGGYGGPPRTEQERAARQAACREKNGGVCPNGGPAMQCPGLGSGNGPRNGQGKGAGNGWGRGLRDGTGPRSGNGTCPNVPAPTGK